MTTYSPGSSFSASHACMNCAMVKGLASIDYDLVVEGEVAESAEFVVYHGEYVRGAPDYKYCLLCYTMKPLDALR